MKDDKPEKEQEDRVVGSPRARLFLFFYLIIIIMGAVYLIVNFWVPSIPSIDIKSITTATGNQSNITVPAVPATITAETGVNASNITLALTEPANLTTVTTTSENSTTLETTTETFLELVNGTKQILSENQTSVPKNGTIVFLQLQSTNPEVRLLSVALLFGILGASISGMTSVLNRKLWTSKRARSVRLNYVYFARPWVGSAIALITYAVIRAGLLNVANIASISEFGIAAICALVGLMTDEMTIKLRDVFRTLFGIAGLQAEPELRLSIERKISKNKEYLISATLTDLRPTQLVEAHFLVQDTDKVELTIKDKIYFNDSGVAIASIKGINEGETLVSVIAGDLDLYDSQKIEVEA
ncbi:MAG TPA: hypothetical protein VD710_02865 [Nitrososphaeraceae archaeon]|nr:hypothetical protein [Nitrososphaeraceae archaeon]